MGPPSRADCGADGPGKWRSPVGGEGAREVSVGGSASSCAEDTTFLHCTWEGMSQQGSAHASVRWLDVLRTQTASGKWLAVGTCVRAGERRPIQSDTRDSHSGAGLWCHLPPSAGGLFLCWGLAANEGQADHVGLTAGEGVALNNVVQRQPAPGATGLRPPRLACPHRGPRGLAPPCSPGRNGSL